MVEESDFVDHPGCLQIVPLPYVLFLLAYIMVYT